MTATIEQEVQTTDWETVLNEPPLQLPHRQKLSPEAVELLIRVRDHIIEHPKQVSMNVWLETGDLLYDCYTVGCIAGWMVTLSGTRYNSEFDIHAKASGLLGCSLPTAAGMRLFFVNHWPQPFAGMLSGLGPATPKYAAVVAARIDRFIDTDGQG